MTDSDGRRGKGSGLKAYRELSPLKGSRRVGIRPVSASGGIPTGVVMAYGHIIPAPYHLEYRGTRLFVNGVQVEPSILRDKATVVPKPTPDDQRHLSRVKAVDQAAQDLYRATIHTKSIEEVHAAVLKLLKASPDVFEEPQWTGPRTLLARLAGSRISYLIQFSEKPSSVLSDQEVTAWERERSGKARKADLVSLRRQLEMGYSLIFLAAGGRASNGDFRQRVRKIMEEPGLSADRRAELLEEKVFNDYEAALDIIENYDPLEWQTEQIR